MYAQYQQQAGIPEQQCIGQTLPPVPVGIDTMHSSPIPSGAMPNGTWLHVGRYNVVIHNFIAQGKDDNNSCFTSVYVEWNGKMIDDSSSSETNPPY